jgi:hypothetical protein
MPGTQITQTRQPVAVDTGTKFQVAATCTLAGTLPGLEIFVRQVVTVDDPKDDTFLRVAGVTDFTDYGTDREASISSSEFIYRASAVTLTYDDVTTATAAWNELSSRINTLVTEYDAYISVFLTPSTGAITTYPTVDPSEKQALIDTYKASLAAVTSAEDARDADLIECEQKQFELESLQSQLADAQSDVAALTPIVSATAVLNAAYPSSTTTVSSANSAANALVVSSTATAGEKSLIQAQLSAVDVAANALTVDNASLSSDVYTPLLALLGSLQTRVASLQTEVTAKQLEANDCARNLAVLQGSVDQARSQRDADLAAIRAVCPDFNPATDL